MSWLGFSILIAGLYFLVLLIRGLIQFGTWFYEERLGGNRRLRPHERIEARHRELEELAEAERRREEAARQRAEKRHALHASGAAAKPKHASLPARLLRGLRVFVFRRGYDYWVGCALAEPDAALKVEYLRKALKLNPTYLPAWGLAANTLVDLKRYEEAIVAFEHSLELRSSGLMWYKKGLCYHNLHKPEEAIRCFDQALAAAGADRELQADASRMKRAAQAELLKPSGPVA